MAGARVNILPLTTLDFASFAVGQSVLLPLTAPIDVLQYTGFQTQLRVHAVSIATGNSLVFDLMDDGFVPGSDVPYIGNGNIAGGIVDDQTVAPTMIHSTVRRAAGQFVSLAVVVNRAVAGALTATVSIDVTLLSPDERDDSWLTAR
jgi:hypothetical protein